MTARQSVSRKGFLLVLIPVIFELVFVAGLTVALLHAEEESDRIGRAKETVQTMNGLDASIVNSLMSIVRADRHQDERSIAELDKNIAAVNASKLLLSQVDIKRSNANPEWFKRAQALCDRTIAIVQLAKQTLLDANVPRSRKLLPVRRDIYLILLELRPLKQEVLAQSKEVHALAPKQQASDMAVVYAILAFGLVANVFISIVLVAFFSRDFERRLGKISANAERLAIGRPLVERVGGNDEISDLDLILHNTETELTDARRKELSVLDNAADVIVSLDRTFHITAAGQSAEKVWQYSGEQLLGQSIFFFLTEKTAEASRLALKEIEKSGQEGNFENTVRLKDGSLKDTAWSATWSQENQNFYCVARDISERKALERLKQRFASIIGDDLNSSLSTISEGLVAMKEGDFGKLEGKAYDNVFKAEISINRLIELANDLLDLEKIESGKLTIQAKPLSAAKLCDAAIDAVEAFARGAKIELGKPAQDATVYGEERRIVQALINLLSNAIKFSPSKSSIETEISVAQQYVEISVVDHGPGIAEKDRLLIFEKFRQSKAVTDKEIKSTGLGLAIVKAIMEAHGGTAGVDSKEGEGSRFWLRFSTQPEEKK